VEGSFVLGEAPLVPEGVPPAPEDVPPVPEDDPLPEDVPSEPGAITPVPEEVPSEVMAVSTSLEEDFPVDGAASVFTEGVRGVVCLELGTRSVDVVGRRDLSCKFEVSGGGEDGILSRPISIGDNGLDWRGGIKPYSHKAAM
jgi:hypothetical protein